MVSFLDQLSVLRQRLIDSDGSKLDTTRVTMQRIGNIIDVAGYVSDEAVAKPYMERRDAEYLDGIQ